MAENLYLQNLNTPKRRAALEFFQKHPNEVADGEIGSQVLAQLRGLGLLKQHESDRQKGTPLFLSAWALSKDGELALSLWKGRSVIS